MKILLADDDSDDIWLFRDFLQHRLDINLLTSVKDGVEVMDCLGVMDSSDFPQIIILDQNMPKLNGMETLYELKADTRYNRIEVVIYSTYTDQGLIDECIKLGALTVQTKPVSREGYNEMIDVILEIYAGQVRS